MIGEGIDRVDGPAKAQGAVVYSGDLVLEGMVHAALVQSPISNGRIAALDTARATSLAGVLAVLHHANAPRLAPRGAGEMPLLLQDDRINYGGQPIAAVIAGDARHGPAGRGPRRGSLQSRPSVSVLRRNAPDLFAPAAVLGEPPDSVRGDPARASAEAEVRLDATYTAPMQHHNPIEPHVALASWEAGRLTLYASLQGVQACRDVLARSFGLTPDSVRVVARFLGGGFGSKGRSWWPCVMIAVMAARLVGRPVRLELSRDEMFRMVGCRAASIHRVAIGARADGRLTALEHHAVAQSSAVDEFCDPHGRISQMLYACPAVATSHRLARIHAPHPTPMRPPATGPAASPSNPPWTSSPWRSRSIRSSSGCATMPTAIRTPGSRGRASRSANATRSGRSGSDGGAGVPSLGRCETAHGSSDGAWRAPRIPCIASAPPPARCSWRTARWSSSRPRTTSAPAPTPS